LDAPTSVPDTFRVLNKETQDGNDNHPRSANLRGQLRSRAMTRLLHIAASPRGESSESLQIAQTRSSASRLVALIGTQE
jgi:hypothetical protein